MAGLGRFDLLSALCVVAGLALVAENLGYVGQVHKLWPLLPAAAAAGLVVLGFGPRRAEIGLLGVGVYLLLCSGLFLFLNFARWGLLAQWWPVFIGFLGVSFAVVALRVAHRRLFLFVGSALIALAVTFFMVFSIDSKLWPISLILLGISLFTTRIGSHDRQSCPHR